VPVDEPADPHALLDRLATGGWIDAGAAGWLGEWLTRLATDEPPRALVHGDVAPQNLLVSPSGELVGLIDWGDAALADPATDFAKLPFPQVPAALRGYREAGAPDFPWERRVLWHRVTWALGRLDGPAPGNGRHWSAPPFARLLDLLHFFATDPPDPWRSLAPGVSG
jgi:serine/threonine protein kinase